MQDHQNSKYIKTIGIALDHYDLIKQIKHKKSLAGKLSEIIEFYIKHNKIKNIKQ